MPSLLSTLQSSSNALNAFDQVLAVTQNNVSNASTPGYVKQTISLHALPLDVVTGAMGGVRAGEVHSARNEYAEQAVRRQTLALGGSQQKVNSLQALQSLFDVTGNTGSPAALNNLYQSFSAWGQSPADTTARQTVLDRAATVANAFQQAASGLSRFSSDTEQQLHQTVDQVNTLVGQLQDCNSEIMQGDGKDPSLDARVHSLLEELSQYVDFSAMPQSNGTVDVLLNGQTPLLVANKKFDLAFSMQRPENPDGTYSEKPPAAHITAGDGTDITSQITGGQLGALLDVRNRMIPSYLGDATQAGDLNVMAKQFADRVNNILTSGHVSDGDPANGIDPVFGAAIFQYDNTNDTNVAASLTVDPAIGPAQMGAIDPGPPYVSNGIPLALSGLADPRNDGDRIDGVSYASYYGSLAARAGTALNEAQDELTVRQSTTAQAKQLRQQMSGVSLDEEAATLVQFQRAYEATSRMITVLNQLTEDTINILQP